MGVGLVFRACETDQIQCGRTELLIDDLLRQSPLETREPTNLTNAFPPEKYRRSRPQQVPGITIYLFTRAQYLFKDSFIQVLYMQCYFQCQMGH